MSCGSPGRTTSGGICRQAAMAVTVIALMAALGLWAWAQNAGLPEALELIRAQRFAEAREMLEGYVAQHPQELGARFWLARAHLGEGNAPAAIVVFAQVLEAKPSSIDSRLWLAVALAEDGRHAAARRELDAVLAKRPGDPIATALDARLEQAAGPDVHAAPPDFEPIAPGQRGQVVLVTGGLAIEPGSVDILSRNLYDYTFSSAPVDWQVGNGTWHSIYRWACQPQWSWYGGYSMTGPAAIWTKREFAGDIVVEAYAAFQHKFDVQTRPYKNPSNLNITICGDGRNFDSGYTFMFGAERNTTTRIMKGTNILAATSEPEALLPVFENGGWGDYNFHRRWWGLRVSKLGDKLQFFVDNNLVCEAEDPTPLSGGRAAIWTYDNGIVIPRVKIYYEAELSRRTATVSATGPESLTAPVAAEVVVSSASHPSIQNDFENGLGSWAPWDDDGVAQLAVLPGGVDNAGHCLKVTNAQTGGSFGTRVHPEAFDAARMGLMSFDYRINPEVAVNFYLTVDKQLYEILFTGPAAGATHSRLLGQIPAVQTDDEWHHAEFDLFAHLHKALGRADKLTVSDLFIGNLSNEDYLGAGFGRNHAGACYYLDNFALLMPSAETAVHLTVKPGPASRTDQYVVTLDADATPSEPGEAVPVVSGPAEVEAPGPGAWYAHVYPKLSDNQWGAPASYRIQIDREPPRLTAQPPSGGQLTDEPLAISVDDPGGAGLDVAALCVEIDGQEYTIADPVVDFDPADGQLIIDPRRAGITLSEGGSLVIGLGRVSDRAGNALAEPLELSYTFNAGQDRIPPVIGSMRLGTDYLCNEDFEVGLGRVSAFGGDKGAVLVRDDRTAASGGYSLNVVNSTEGGAFGVYLYKWPFDAGKYRLIAFDYKIPARLRVDLALEIDGEWQAIRFTDTTHELAVIGTVPDVQADDRWHHAEIDIYQLLRRANPLRCSYRVSRVVLADFGWRGNCEGQAYHLDNLQIIPVDSSAQPPQLIWEALDLSGIAGISWLVSKEASARLPTQVAATTSPTSLGEPGDHNGWLYLAACDHAGNWSEPVSRRLLLDGDPPAGGGVQPAAGAAAAPGEIEMVLYDGGLAGVDPASIHLKIDDSEYRVDNTALTYNAQTNRLAWHCQRVRPEPVVFPDQHNVAVSLQQATDFAGNELAEPVEWSWRMDYSKDTEPPLIAGVHSPSHPTVACYTFEDDLGAVRTDSGGAEVSRDSSTMATGKYSLKLTKRQGSRLDATIHTTPFDAAMFPLVMFDYNIPPDVNIGLTVRVGQERTGYAISGPVQSMAGKVPDVIADGRWHRAGLRLALPARGRGGEKRVMVDEVRLTDNGPGANKVGATVHIDNFVIGRLGSGPGRASWRATDPTGIAGYSWALDKEPNTVPSETIKTRETETALDGLDSGLWFFHVRARDGAGNWGPVTRCALLNQ